MIFCPRCGATGTLDSGPAYAGEPCFDCAGRGFLMPELPAPIVVDTPAANYVLYDLSTYAHLTARGVGELLGVARGQSLRIKVRGESQPDQKLRRLLGPALHSLGMCEPGIWLLALSLPARPKP